MSDTHFFGYSRIRVNAQESLHGSGGKSGNLIRTGKVDELMRYAAICRVEKIIRPYLEALLF